MLYFLFAVLVIPFNLRGLIFSWCPCFIFSFLGGGSLFLRVYLRAFALFPLHLASPICFPWSRLSVFAWSLCRVALAPLCFACVGVVVVVSDYVFSLAPLSFCIVLLSSCPVLFLGREFASLPWRLVGLPRACGHPDGCPCSTAILLSWNRGATASPP